MNDRSAQNGITPEIMARSIDHTILKPDAMVKDVERLVQEAMQYRFGAVCVNSCHVKRAASLLSESGVETCSVVGFPLGATHPKAKAFEAEMALEDGATELDMVLNIGALKDGEYALVQSDIESVKRAAGPEKILKVIIETCLLSENEKVKACKLAMAAGADFVKTSTGFAGSGASLEDVRLMKRTVGSTMQVKASGGIKDWKTAAAMLLAGASRIGTSSGVAILQNIPS